MDNFKNSIKSIGDSKCEDELSNSIESSYEEELSNSIESSYENELNNSIESNKIYKVNQSERLRRFRKVLVIWLSLVGFGLVLGIVLNHFGLYLPCLFREITGYKCPGCGVTRMSLAIIRLDFTSAFYYNPVVFLLLPVIFIILANMSISYINNSTLKLSRALDAVTKLMIVVLIVFGIVRNIV